MFPTTPVLDTFIYRFPTTPILDDADRADEGPPPSANWSAVDGISGTLAGLLVDDNEIAGSAASSANYWNTLFLADSEARFTLTALPDDTNAIQIYIRTDGTVEADAPGYYIVVQRDDLSLLGGAITLFRRSGGGGTSLAAPVEINLQVGDSFGIQAVSNDIRVWYKPVGESWSPVTTVTNSDWPDPGYIILLFEDTTARVDDIGGGEIGEFGPPPSDDWSTPDLGPSMFGLVVDDGRCAVEAGQEDAAAVWNDATPADCEVYAGDIDFSTIPLAGNVSLYLRWDPDTGAGYRLLLQPGLAGGDAFIQLQTADGLTAVFSVLDQDVLDGDAFGIRAVGNDFTAWKLPEGETDWIQIGSGSDSTTPGGGLLGLVLFGEMPDNPTVGYFGGGEFVPTSQQSFMAYYRRRRIYA